MHDRLAGRQLRHARAFLTYQADRSFHRIVVADVTLVVRASSTVATIPESQFPGIVTRRANLGPVAGGKVSPSWFLFRHTASIRERALPPGEPGFCRVQQRLSASAVFR